jgi:hypothetical protein
MRAPKLEVAMQCRRHPISGICRSHTLDSPSQTLVLSLQFRQSPPKSLDSWGQCFPRSRESSVQSNAK